MTRSDLLFPVLMAATLVAFPSTEANGHSAVGSQAADVIFLDPASPTCDSLLAEVRAPQQFGFGMADVERAAVEADHLCVPALEAVLQSGVDLTSYRAALALSTIGGRDAVEALRREYEKTDETRIKSHLATAMGSLGQEADIRFLIDALQGEHVGNTTWPPIQSAALTLGLLRAKDARSALTTSAGKGGIAGGAARDALTWLDRPPCRTRLPAGMSSQDGAVVAVLQCIAPRTAQGSRFFEAETSRVWQLRDGRWSVRPASGSEAEQLPTIKFEVHTSGDGSRGIVATGMTFGPRNGSGYSYTLERVAGEWVVRTIKATWIS